MQFTQSQCMEENDSHQFLLVKQNDSELLQKFYNYQENQGNKGIFCLGLNSQTLEGIIIV